MKQTCRNYLTVFVPGVKDGIFVLMRVKKQMFILEKKPVSKTFNLKEGRNNLDIASGTYI